MKGQLVENNGNTFLDFLLVLKIIQPKQLYFSLVNVYDVQKAADCGGFACAVLTDKAHNRAFRNIETDIIQRKAAVFFCNTLDFNCIFIRSHCYSPPFTRSSKS